MRLIKNIICQECQLKCDIYLTAKEMGIESELKPQYFTFKKHEIICKQNELVSSVFVIISGNAKMYINGLNNRNIILNILIPSNYIGLLSVFGSADYSFSVAAINNCTTCNIDLDFVKEMYLRNHNFLMKLNNAFVNSVSAIMGKLISLNQKQIRGKVADSLLYLSQLYDSNNYSLIISRKELGELSAISEENVVRVLTEFKNEDIIGVIGKEIELKDVDMLKRISIIG
jgi:CRP-like cAMP-binding protein